MLNNYEFKTKHSIVETQVDDTTVVGVKLEDSPFTGIIVQYGKVSFDNLDAAEAADKIVLNFDYEILDAAGIEYNTESLEMYLGDVLQDIIAFEIRRKSLSDVIMEVDV